MNTNQPRLRPEFAEEDVSVAEQIQPGRHDQLMWGLYLKPLEIA
ncbi:hypothetical protein [Micromonospora sp. D93]|nr:hypothetical protein [Micromonospora sp. D93]